MPCALCQSLNWAAQACMSFHTIKGGLVCCRCSVGVLRVPGGACADLLDMKEVVLLPLLLLRCAGNCQLVTNCVCSTRT